MAYSFARDDFGFRGGVNAVPHQSSNMLGVTRNTTEPVFLSGSRIETTPGYVELNSVNVYDKANNYGPNKPSAPTKTSSISQNINPYGWFDHSLAATRARTPVSENRNEIDNNLEYRSEPSDRQLHTDQGFSDLGQTRQSRRQSHTYADNVRIDRSERYPSREMSGLRQTVQHPPEINVHAPETPALTNLGRTQLRSTVLKATVVEDDKHGNPYGWQVLGPTRHQPATDSVHQGGSEGNYNKTDNIYTSGIHSEAKLPPSTTQFSNFKFGDTLVPPKRQMTGTNLGQTMTGINLGQTVTGTNLGQTITGTNLGQTMTGTNLGQTLTGTKFGQTMTYDYPYMRHVRRSSEDGPNVSSQKWIEMATDHGFMRWLYLMFAKIRSKWGKGENPMRQLMPPPDYRHEQQRTRRKRRHEVSLYSCPQRSCIGLIVTILLIFAALIPVLLITSYKQESPKPGMYTIECTLPNFMYVDTLGNQSSEDFINTSQSFCNEIDRNINFSSIDIGYIGCIVNQISNGDSTQVKLTFSVVFQYYLFISQYEILELLNLVPDDSVITLGQFIVSNNIHIQPFIILNDDNNPFSEDVYKSTKRQVYGNRKSRFVGVITCLFQLYI